MPLTPTPTGFIVSYSRDKCVLFGLGAILFSLMMLAVGLDAYIHFFDGTLFERFELDRRPPWAWGAVMITGGAALSYVAAWNVKNAFRPGAAVIVSRDGIDAKTLIGRRTMRWDDIGDVKVFRGTVFVYPVAGASAKPAPLQTILTSVSADELTRALAQFRPALFGEVEEG